MNAFREVILQPLKQPGYPTSPESIRQRQDARDALDFLLEQLDELPGLWHAVKESQRRVLVLQRELDALTRNGRATWPWERTE